MVTTRPRLMPGAVSPLTGGFPHREQGAAEHLAILRLPQQEVGHLLVRTTSAPRRLRLVCPCVYEAPQFYNLQPAAFSPKAGHDDASVMFFSESSQRTRRTKISVLNVRNDQEDAAGEHVDGHHTDGERADKGSADREHVDREEADLEEADG